ERGRPCLRVPLVVGRDGVVVNLDGQRSDWFIQISRKEPAAKRSKKERRGFAGYSRNRQHCAGGDARGGGGNDDAERDSPLRRTEGQRAFAQTVRHQPNHFLSC